MEKLIYSLLIVVIGCQTSDLKVHYMDSSCLNKIKINDRDSIYSLTYFIENNESDTVEMYETSIGTSYPLHTYYLINTIFKDTTAIYFDRESNYKYDSTGNILLEKILIPPGQMKRFEFEIISSSYFEFNVIHSYAEYYINNDTNLVKLTINLKNITKCY